jgi:cell division protein FtsB
VEVKLFDLLTLVNFGCWGLCFWWMHRISARQDAVLRELQQQARRIERLSEDEHELLREMHPAVEDIKASVEGVRSSGEEQK